MNYTPEERTKMLNSGKWSKNDIRLLVRDCEELEKSIPKKTFPEFLVEREKEMVDAIDESTWRDNKVYFVHEVETFVKEYLLADSGKLLTFEIYGVTLTGFAKSIVDNSYVIKVVHDASGVSEEGELTKVHESFLKEEE